MEFEITAPDGRTLSIEGDSIPNEQELEEIFANVKSDFNSSKAKTSDIFSADGLPSDTPSKLMQVGEFLKEGVAKPVAQGYFNLAKGFGGMMNWYADQSRLSKEDAEALDISEDVRQKLNTFSDILNIAGDSVRYGSEEWLEKEWIKSDPEVFKGEFFENPSWTRASAAVASALPSFTSILAFGKSNFALGYALMAGSENADIYLEAKEKVGEEKASGLFLAGTAGTAAIDIAMKPVEKIIKPLKGGFIDRMAERAIRGGMEALPESMQQVYQNAVKKYGYDATQSLWSGVIESAIGGFGMGAVAAGAEGLINQGATEEEVEQLQNVAVESIVANSKELNDIAYQDMKKTLTKINEKFANMSEDDVMRIGRELEEGFGKYYRELSQIMPEEQARSNAALIRNHAFFASDAMGISPKEYFDKYAPKIEKMNFYEFNGQKAQFEEVYKRMNEIDAEEFAKGIPEYTAPTININGIERQTANSSGEPIAKSQRSLEYFYNWFGDSKVVDEQGRPLVVYHGTRSPYIREFKAKYDDKLIFFAYKKQFAEDWAKHSPLTEQQEKDYRSVNISDISRAVSKDFRDKYGENWSEDEALLEKAYKEKDRRYIEKLEEFGIKETIYPVYLKAENTFIPSEHWDLVIDEIGKYYNIDFLKDESELTDNEKYYLNNIKNGHWIMFEHKNVMDKLRRLGFDSIQLEEISGQGVTTIAVFDGNNQIKSTSNRGTFDPTDNRIYYQGSVNENIYKATNSNEEPIANPANFNVFIEGSKVTDNDEPVSPSNPPKKIYRGDTRYFEKYEPQENAYEYDWGKGFYLSDDYDDVAENYQSGGADLTNRIDREAEQYAEDNDISYDEAREKVREQYEKGDIIREFYLSIKEPVIIGGEKETFFDYTEEYDEKTDEYGEPQGKLLDLVYGIENYLADIGADEYTQAITGKLYEEALDGGLSASQVEDIVRDTEEATILVDYESSPGEMLSSVFGSIGFDGIIDHRAGTKFKGMNMNPDTTHYVVFNSEQAKSTDNRGEWGVKEGNFYYQSAFAGSRVDYDRPSLEAIGSGEGAQAHGWGLYYALSKDVAESYRRAFLGVKYNGVDWKDTVIAKYDQFIQNALLSGDKTKQEKIITYFENSLTKEQTRLNAYLSESTKNMSNSEKKVRKLHIEAAQERIKKLTPVVDFVKSFDISKLKTEGGQVHEVDIPENPYLLDEDRTISGQSKYVKDILKSIPENLAKDKSQLASETYESLLAQKKKENASNKMYGLFGEDYYKVLSETLGSDKAASQYLEKLGIKGITYEGRQDGRCFVIFNPDDVKVIQKFYQDEQAPRGAFANDTIYLFENANESTLPHELTHSWQKELRRINETNHTEKLTGMLEQIDNWTSSEFTRKYNVSKRNYGYAVIDKRGNVVYDNRGNGFLTEQDAVEYAKNEIFARGFEQYVREGKAPNNSLKQAFRNFFMWLKKIYRDAMDLNIQLSPDIKNVYADLLGGVDVDFFLDATPESFIQQRIKLGEQREKTLDGIIQDAQANKQRVVKTKRGKGFSRVWATAMIPLSTRAKRISPKLRNVLRKYEFTLSNELNKKYDKVRPFMDLWKNMSEDDIIAFDFALKNDYVAKQLEIVDKYNARKEWEAVRETLENIYDEALNAGLDINWRPDYFPRKVKDVDGFLSYLHNAPEWTRFQQAISEAGLDGATAEEQAEFLNKYLRGFVKVDLMPNKYGSEKERKIDIIDNEMNQFYAPSIEALVGYIEGLNSRIVSSKFLGKGDNIEESIGGYLTYLLNNDIIAPEQIDEARNILRARFDARGVSNPWLANMRNYSYMYTMGGINSAITQIEDLSVAMYKAGVWNTLTTAMESKRITKKDLGLTSISAEFVEQSKSASYLNKLFKLTGLDGIDSFGKETLVNAELKKFQKMSDETLREYIEPIMENETNATIQDIRNDNISDNVLYLMFSELSDVQPISLSELPEFYNRGGNLRILYMLKSFALKRIDIFRNECVDKIKSKDFNQVKEGMQNLLKLSALMVICGSSKDWLIDLLYGRETDLSERVLNNILGLVGLSKFQIYQAKEKGFTGTVKDIVVPPLFAVFDDLFTDVAKGVQGKREIKDFEVWKGIPLVGRFYYWWVGRGSEKQKKNKKY